MPKKRRMLIPFSVLPPPLLVRLVRRMPGVGGMLVKIFPSLPDDLIQTRMPVAPHDYAGAAFFNAVVNGIVVALVLLLVGIASKTGLAAAAPFLGVVIGLVSFTTVIYYPRIVARRRMRVLERDLIPATRQLLIELRSGVPLYNAMASISDDYDELSAEFKKIVDKISGGTPEVDALADASHENPSLKFKKVVWQISNALKVGSDVSGALEAVARELEREQVNEIRRYGQELSPWTMLYMMAAIVIPSLGMTLLTIVASLLNFPVPWFFLPGGIAYLIVFQLFFMNFIASRRPAA